MESPSLYISHDAEFDNLCAHPFGITQDRQGPERWAGVSDEFGWFLDRPGGRRIGFTVHDFSDFDPETDDVSEIWQGARFTAPVLGLADVSAGEIIVASRAFFAGESSLNRRLFRAAMNAEDGLQGAALWRECLQAGDVMAHYGLGYTLYELGLYREAYTHLRAYTELVPADTWAWCWTGKAAHAIGDQGDAERCYRHAMGIETDAELTDAGKLLAALRAGLPPEAIYPDDQAA